jgi:hypothetical protein
LSMTVAGGQSAASSGINSSSWRSRHSRVATRQRVYSAATCPASAPDAPAG